MSRPLAAPFITASGTLTSRELVLLRLEDDEGNVGYGEAAPLRATPDQVLAALHDCLPVLEAADGAAPEPVLAECRQTAVLPEAVAAIDLALWDLAGRRAGEPVWQLLGASSSRLVPVNATIAAPDRASAASQAAAARDQGFRALKLKVGLGDDGGRLAAVRAAAGPEMILRLDANGAWTVAEARAALGALAPAGIELCEEPVHGLGEIAVLARDCPVAIAIDESTSLPGALAERVCDAVCLKVAACGGITGLVAGWRAASAVGYDVYLASTLDGPLGIAAALHAAAVIKPGRPCGLATLGLFEAAPGFLVPTDGALEPPAGAGLGSGLVAWYENDRVTGI